MYRLLPGLINDEFHWTLVGLGAILVLREPSYVKAIIGQLDVRKGRLRHGPFTVAETLGFIWNLDIEVIAINEMKRAGPGVGTFR